MSLKGIPRSWRARLEVTESEYAANETNDVLYDLKVTIRPDVFLTSWPGINYGFCLFNIFKGTFGCEDRMYIGWTVKLFVTILLSK